VLRVTGKITSGFDQIHVKIVSFQKKREFALGNTQVKERHEHEEAIHALRPDVL
jgi:hypothetical protein